jgi:predicted phage tail protein
MATALVIFAAWTLGALVVARLATGLGWKAAATAPLVAGAILLVTGASQVLPGVVAAWRTLNPSASTGPYHDTYYVVG